jgi:hypothetical protein
VGIAFPDVPTIYVSFNHEPDTPNSEGSGTATEFIAAYRTFVTVMREQGVTNARWAFTTAMRNYSVSQTSRKYAPKYYPGDDWIDVIAIDAYNMYCRKLNGSFANPWRSLATLLAPFMQFVALSRCIPDPTPCWPSGARLRTRRMPHGRRRGSSMPAHCSSSPGRAVRRDLLVEPAVAHLRQLRLRGSPRALPR